MTRGELIAIVKAKVVGPLVEEVQRETLKMRREVEAGHQDATCSKDGLTRADALVVLDLVNDYLAHCERWSPAP